ncbi:tetratricopeptide repeat protein [Scopulibacillus darangshiensis]|uniref:Tetratricopeptide repeat protein n=1 Tax=Scopulibacillus darangshiensis TaxID=442528 RepID=A0A4R2PAU7_9BACL|nr:tetratricopeptide repeat protein [Scopulibacillus darangshiensis]TCP32210.1 tetratricopeptide repeat protein [Scopulibacillus darangshiensis]
MRRNDNSRRRRQDNLFFFPQLDERLVEKGVQALKNKQYVQARDLFEQLHELDADHPQAAYGLSICYVELGEYERAEALTEDMLKRDVGDYFDVLRLHITVLIQKRRYKKVIEMIEAVLEEGDVPPDLEVTFQQLAEFSKVRMEEKTTSEVIQDEGHAPHIGREPRDNIDLSGLSSIDPEQQWLTIQKLQHSLSPEDYPQLEDFLTSDEGDPFIKSIVLKTIKDSGFNGIIRVKKFGDTYELTPEIDILFYEGFSDEVKVKIKEVLASDNPTLCDLAEQIWQHFIVAVYPKPLEPDNTDVWAAACSLYTYQINGIETNQDALIQLLNVFERDVQNAVGLIKRVEESASGKKL